jgi:hypothetical protein
MSTSARYFGDHSIFVSGCNPSHFSLRSALAKWRLLGPLDGQWRNGFATGNNGHQFRCTWQLQKDPGELNRSKANLRLIDGEQLVELMFRQHEAFEPSYLALLPLRPVYVPRSGTCD